MKNLLVSCVAVLALAACGKSGYKLTDLEMRNAINSGKLQAAQVKACNAESTVDGFTACTLIRGGKEVNVMCPYRRGSNNELKLCRLAE